MASKKTIKASPAMVSAVVKRQVRDMLDATRARVEASLGCGQSRAIAAAEALYMGGRISDAADACRNIGKALDVRVDAADVKASVEASLKSAKDRGETAEQDPETGAGRILSRDGLLWLKQKRRMPVAELTGCERYRSLHNAVHASPLGSRYGDQTGSSGSRVGFSPPDASVQLNAARLKGLNDDRRLIDLMDRVAGRGETLRDIARGDDKEAAKLEVELRVGARMLARHFGLAA